MYINKFRLPNDDRTYEFILGQKETCFNSFYPFKVFENRNPVELEFGQVTFLCGGNGSGKTTLLNLIAESLQLKRVSRFNKSSFFDDYVKMCDYELAKGLPEASSIITSDDVFDYMLDMRAINEGIDYRREELREEYINLKGSNFKMESLDDYEKLKAINNSRKITQSEFIRRNIGKNLVEKSNGESGFQYFVEKINEPGLYLLDEPENSLSPPKQIELMKYLEDSARFFNCQFIISTHSPFMPAMKDCKIYNLDVNPIEVSKWTELENIRTYYDFFIEHNEEF